MERTLNIVISIFSAVGIVAILWLLAWTDYQNWLELGDNSSLISTFFFSAVGLMIGVFAAVLINDEFKVNLK